MSSPKWYILGVKVNAEDSTLLSINNAISMLKGSNVDTISKNIHKMEILKKEVSRFQNGKNIVKKVPIYPGYILVLAEMNSAIIDFFRSNYFGSFLGIDKTPAPISETEYMKMVDYANSINKSFTGDVFVIGKKVKISSGSFSSMEGEIKNINNDKKELKLLVPIFGQETEIDIPFKDVSVI